MNLIKSIATAAALGALSLSAEAALLGRDLNGSPGSYEAYYDTTLNITWLANANLAKTNTFGVSGITANGYMTWNTANAWIAAMNSANYLGVSSWRLPSFYDIGSNGCTVYSYTSYNGGDCGYNVVSTGPQASEMASLYYDTLGNVAYYNTSGGANYGGSPHIQNTGPFTNLGNTLYWYAQSTSSNPDGTDFGPPDSNAWYFGMPSGGQRPIDMLTVSPQTAWAVFSGDIQAVPVPGAVWLLGSALGALGLAKKRRQD